MQLIKPFQAIRPEINVVQDMLAPPYDVVSRKEAYKLAHQNPLSFLRISRPEIDLDPAIDPYSPIVYQTGKKNFQRLLETKQLIQDPQPYYYLYRLTMGKHQQTGLVATFSVAAYNTNRIRRHELTRPKKENDRIAHINELNAQISPVLLAHKPVANLKTIIAAATAKPPLYQVTDHQAVQHELWIINEQSIIQTISDEFNQLEALYIADGHHRSAAAAKIADANPDNPLAQYFLGVIFAADELQILGYHRIMIDLNNIPPAELLAKITEHFSIKKSDTAIPPSAKGEFGMYLDHSWYQLSIKPAYAKSSDAVKRLDVSLLHDLLIEPIFGIHDPRNDERIDFVGGIRGIGSLQQAVDSGAAKIAFALYPTSLPELFAVADQNSMMPPKSTWFEPKLADGLVAYKL